MANDKIERLVNILIELKGAEETERAIDEMYDSAKKGSRDAKTGAEEAEPKINLFLQRWKTQALTLAAALGGLWGLARYSSVASGLVNMLGASVGLLGDTLLVHLAEPAEWVSEKLMGLAEWFDGLPEPIQKLTAYVLGLGVAFKVLKALGLTNLFTSIAGGLLSLAGIDTSAGIIAGLETAMAGGGAAAAAAWLAAIGAGLALGLVGVGLLVYSGALDWVSDMGRAFEEKCPWAMDILKGIFGSFASFGVVAIDIVTGRIDKIPEDVGKVMDEVYAAWGRTWDRIRSLISRVWDATLSTIGTAWDQAWNRIQTTAENTISSISSGIRSTIQGVVDWIGSLNPFSGWQVPSFSMPSLPKLPFFASGGYVAETGLAMLHKGEYVTSSFKAKVRDGSEAKSAGRIQIQQVVLQGKFESEYDMYRRFLALLEREGRRAI